MAFLPNFKGFLAYPISQLGRDPSGRLDDCSQEEAWEIRARRNLEEVLFLNDGVFQVYCCRGGGAEIREMVFGINLGILRVDFLGLVTDRVDLLPWVVRELFLFCLAWSLLLSLERSSSFS